MALEVMIILMILIPIVLFVILRMKRESGMSIAVLLYQIAGIFLLVFGLILLFPAFYLFFYSKGGRMDITLLVLSLVMVAAGFFLTNRFGKKQNSSTVKNE